ncbi:unnamed protein product [Oncorhynchus mykiss]|uniref:Uncharacterized protein n=1 Tax=Oncorhynchus mykiss TaxID=8022 RepID=A0A060YS91_ONCMY|nr:unnamed protein product [Oncorhynchus mykiss]
MNGPNFYILLLAGVLVNGRELRWEKLFDQPLQFKLPFKTIHLPHKKSTCQLL